MNNKAGNILFYVNLFWLIIPIYSSLLGNKNIYLFLSTIVFGIIYISILYVKNQYISTLLIFCIIAYILGVVYFYSPFAVFNGMYLASLLNFKFKDINLLSFRNILFHITVILLLIIFYVKYKFSYEFLLGVLLTTFIFLYYMSMRLIIVNDLKKEEQQKQNKYINNLIAENERNRIGRDLHDTLGNVFATITLKTELSLSLLKKGRYEEVQSELESLSLISKQSMKDVRMIVSNMKFRTIYEELSYAKEILNLANISLETTTNGNLKNIMPTMQSNVSMVIRECVNNIIKHSLATNCKINIEENANKIVIDIEDDGKGFENLTGRELYNIKDRLSLFKGEVIIINLKSPTKIKVTIPYERGII